MADLTALTPPKDLDKAGRSVVFQYISRRLASHRNRAQLFAAADSRTSQENIQAYNIELNKWAQELQRAAWVACQEPDSGTCPVLDSFSDTSTASLSPLPSDSHVAQILNNILFLHITTTKQYHAHTRAFLFSLAITFDERNIAATLKHPDHAIEAVQRKAESAKEEQAASGRTLRMVGMGLGAVAGGAIVGITGGLAAPLIGAGLTTVLSWLGVSGTAVGLLASGLASSSVVCGALFGVYGSKKSAEMVDRFTKEVHDLAIIAIHRLAVRLCVSGWLGSREDVTSPWTVFEGDDTFALQWEVEALMELADALNALVKSQALTYIRGEIIKRTVLASLMAALSPTAWLKVGQIIDNPWVHARSLAVKTGRVLGVLLSQRVLGSLPITLVGYSLGSLVVFEALQYLATLSPSETAHLIQDVYLFGSPIPLNTQSWASARRVVAGRFVNGYGTDDYILAILSRVSDGSWGVSGLGEVPVQGIDNILCEGVEGHLKWRGLMGRSLRLCHAPGVRQGNIGIQMATNTKDIDNIDKNEQGISVSFERVPGDTAIDVSSTDSLSCYNQHP